MTRTEFVYVTYIAATPQRIFDAIVKPEFTRTYWRHENLSDWKPGSKWEHRDAESGEVKLVGKVVETDPPRRLVITWAAPSDAASAGAQSRVTFDLEPIDGMVRLTVTHDQLQPGSEMEQAIRQGWPRVLSSLKSWLETGKALPTWAKGPSAARSRAAVSPRIGAPRSGRMAMVRRAPIRAATRGTSWRPHEERG